MLVCGLRGFSLRRNSPISSQVVKLTVGAHINTDFYDFKWIKLESKYEYKECAFHFICGGKAIYVTYSIDNIPKIDVA